MIKKLYVLYECAVDEDGKRVGDFNLIVDSVTYTEYDEESAPPEQRLFIKMNELAKLNTDCKYWIESIWLEM
jgi:hypothetical protein